MILNKSILYQSMPLPACMFYLLKLKSLVEKKKQHKIHLLQNSTPRDRSWIKRYFHKKMKLLFDIGEVGFRCGGALPIASKRPCFWQESFF